MSAQVPEWFECMSFQVTFKYLSIQVPESPSAHLPWVPKYSLSTRVPQVLECQSTLSALRELRKCLECLSSTFRLKKVCNTDGSRLLRSFYIFCITLIINHFLRNKMINFNTFCKSNIIIQNGFKYFLRKISEN